LVKYIESFESVDKTLIFFWRQRRYRFLYFNVNDTDKLPDIIFLDINMPVMNGWQFLSRYIKFKSEIDKKIMIYIVSL
jgi:CheY-like chemotaxis protein